MKKRKFKQQIVTVKTMGLTMYCETEFGQYRKECEAIDKRTYEKYAEWAEKGGKLGNQIIGDCNSNGVTMIAKLPNADDGQSIVSFCAGVAMMTVNAVCEGSFNINMASRVAGVVFSRLEYEEVEEESV